MATQSKAWDLLIASADGVLRYEGITGKFLGRFASGNGLVKPTGIRFGPDGNLYVSNVGPDTVLSFDGQTGQFIGEVAAGGGLSHPRQVGFKDGKLFVSSRGSNVILTYKMGKTGTGSFIEAFNTTGGEDGLREPFGLIFGPDDNLYVASYGTNEVRRYNGTTGHFMDVFCSGNDLLQPRNIVWGPDSNFYTTSGNHRVLRWDGLTGKFIDTFVKPNSGGLDDPYGLEFGSDGNLYVSSGRTNSVKRYDGVTGDYIDDYVGPSVGGLAAPTYMTFVGGPEGRYDVELWERVRADR